MIVEKGSKGNRNDYEHYETTNDDAHATENTNNLKSTGKGAKKRRAEVVTEEGVDAEDEDDKDD